MKILLTGINGQVGWKLQRTLASLGEVIALDCQELDLAYKNSIRSAVLNVKPDGVDMKKYEIPLLTLVGAIHLEVKKRCS